MISKILDEAQKIMTKTRRNRQVLGNQDFTEAAVKTLEKRETDFSCIYCNAQHIDEYHTYRKAVKLNPYPTTWEPTPYHENWEDLKLHFELDHPEQWGRSEIDPVGPQGSRAWTDVQGQKDRKRALEIYLNIRAYPEYGWNPFLLIHKPGARVSSLWNYRGGPNPTLMGLPEDETIIVGVTWEPRCDPATSKLWDVGNDTAWKHEKESRTHTRAQNAVGPQLNRSLNSVRRILRGSKGNATNLADGCALVRNEEVEGHFAIDLTKVAYKSLYTVNCLLHKRALSAVSAIRLRLGVEGQGNLGQLQVIQRWQASEIPHFVAPNGIVLRDNQEIARLSKEAELQATNNTKEIQEPVESPTTSTNEDTTVAVEQTAKKESAPNIELDTLLAEVRHLCPNTEHFDSVFNNVEAVFEYTRNLQNQMGEWNLNHLQEQVDKLKADVSNAKANEADAQQELQVVNNKLATLGKNPVSAAAHAKVANDNTTHLQTIASLQKQLSERPVSKRDQIAAAGQATVKTIQKPGNITVS